MAFMGQILQQVNVVQEMAQKPMQMMAQQVVGGVWKGKGADAFVQEVQGLLMPNASKISDSMTIVHKNMTRAVDVMDRADAEVKTKCAALGDVFGAIYKG